MTDGPHEANKISFNRRDLFPIIVAVFLLSIYSEATMANKFRRLMIALLMTATLGTAAKAADAPPRQFRIGFLEAGECIGHAILGNEYLRQLRALVPDSVEIVSVPYAYKSAGWKRDTCRAMAAELATIPALDLVVAMGPWAIEDLLEAGFKRHIVGMYRVDPYAEGLLDSAYRPRVANLTVHARPKIESDMAAIKEIINPSRLGVIYFHSGDERKTVLEHMRQVAGNLGMEIVATEGYDANYGARPLRRTIQRIVEDALSEEIIAGRLAGLLSGGAGRLSETATSVS